MATLDVKCPLCGGMAAPRMSLGHTKVWQCASGNCRLQFAHPQPSEQALSSAYSNLYYPSEMSTQEPRFGNTPADTHRQLFMELEKRLGNLQGCRLLDYGCGRGALLEVAAEFGMRIAGIEPDPQARLVAGSIPGASIYASADHLRQVDPDSRFDLIILWTVIEHLRVPWLELAQLRTLLRPGGWLLVSTMDITCLRARIERERWENYENPTHLYYFDRDTLALSIRKAGFTDFSEWRLKLRYPQHGPIRRFLYDICFSLRISDGLFFLCRTANDSGCERPSRIEPEASVLRQGSEHQSIVAPLSQMRSRT